jgi:hypothetical protein
MDTVLSLLGLAGYVIFILALSMGITWAVVKISPSESAREAKRAKRPDPDA